MRGAYCLDCVERGPDLTLGGEVNIADLRAEALPPGVKGTITFTCGRCGTTWVWEVENANGRLVYRNPRRLMP